MIVRWLRFNAVGVAGAAVQLCALWLLTHAAGVNASVAVVIAVELAILHNFVWHELWTWRGQPVELRAARLLRFHTANGLASLVLNPILTWWFTVRCGIPVVPANLIAITAIAVLNFALADGWVFRRGDR